jgi:hypothetical protein
MNEENLAVFCTARFFLFDKTSELESDKVKNIEA